MWIENAESGQLKPLKRIDITRQKYIKIGFLFYNLIYTVEGKFRVTSVLKSVSRVV